MGVSNRIRWLCTWVMQRLTCLLGRYTREWSRIVEVNSICVGEMSEKDIVSSRSYFSVAEILRKSQLNILKEKIVNVLAENDVGQRFKKSEKRTLNKPILYSNILGFIRSEKLTILNKRHSANNKRSKGSNSAKHQSSATIQRLGLAEEKASILIFINNYIDYYCLVYLIVVA